MNTHAAKSYLNFLLRSNNQHGVHSPFVYNLVIRCFYDKKKYEDYVTLRKYRASLISNQQTKEIEDFGSGSKKFDSNFRKVSAIAKTSGSTIKKAFLLYRLVNYLDAKNILELGTALGMGTAALAVGNNSSKVVSVEGSQQLADFSRKKLAEYRINNVEIINEQFSIALKNLKNHQWDLIFIDGHHDQTATINYFETLLPSAHNDTVMIFDDIYWSEGMLKAWKTIVNHPKVTVSIDTFYFGIMFFRKEQNKEHFYIRL
ncbi:class I SAM-dependent methyltransferase [Paucihalobacter ruber]|uniref:Class I SAM-dependent methyltransferase n=1 Tax=Paucihalobacter ruber TaxID=2567861 RepID=A0A506PED6_9FLAO|nr:class I SAM-dependent methyltransferase [Paucihalobacter ruber]TPV32301.1 class I SAM-dependent methyltransferase [Paucihalobacter ruber]